MKRSASADLLPTVHMHEQYVDTASPLEVRAAKLQMLCAESAVADGRFDGNWNFAGELWQIWTQQEIMRIMTSDEIDMMIAYVTLANATICVG